MDGKNDLVKRWQVWIVDDIGAEPYNSLRARLTGQGAPLALVEKLRADVRETKSFIEAWRCIDEGDVADIDLVVLDIRLDECEDKPADLRPIFVKVGEALHTASPTGPIKPVDQDLREMLEMGGLFVFGHLMRSWKGPIRPWVLLCSRMQAQIEHQYRPLLFAFADTVQIVNKDKLIEDSYLAPQLDECAKRRLRMGEVDRIAVAQVLSRLDYLPDDGYAAAAALMLEPVGGRWVFGSFLVPYLERLLSSDKRKDAVASVRRLLGQVDLGWHLASLFSSPECRAVTHTGAPWVSEGPWDKMGLYPRQEVATRLIGTLPAMPRALLRAFDDLLPDILLKNPLAKGLLELEDPAVGRINSLESLFKGFGYHLARYNRMSAADAQAIESQYLKALELVRDACKFNLRHSKLASILADKGKDLGLQVVSAEGDGKDVATTLPDVRTYLLPGGRPLRSLLTIIVQEMVKAYEGSDDMRRRVALGGRVIDHNICEIRIGDSGKGFRDLATYDFSGDGQLASSLREAAPWCKVKIASGTTLRDPCSNWWVPIDPVIGTSFNITLHCIERGRT